MCCVSHSPPTVPRMMCSLLENIAKRTRGVNFSRSLSLTFPGDFASASTATVHFWALCICRWPWKNNCSTVQCEHKDLIPRVMRCQIRTVKHKAEFKIFHWVFSLPSEARVKPPYYGAFTPLWPEPSDFHLHVKPNYRCETFPRPDGEVLLVRIRLDAGLVCVECKKNFLRLPDLLKITEMLEKSQKYCQFWVWWRRQRGDRGRTRQTEWTFILWHDCDVKVKPTSFFAFDHVFGSVPVILLHSHCFRLQTNADGRKVP